jgi:hypothetical protein
VDRGDGQDARATILRAGGRLRRVDGRIGFLPGRVPRPADCSEVLEGVMGKDRMDIGASEASVTRRCSSTASVASA